MFNPGLALTEESSRRPTSAEERRAAPGARPTESRFEAALRSAPVVVFQQDAELRYTWIHNPLLGYASGDIVGRTDRELFGGAGDAELLEAVKRQVLMSGQARRETIILHDRARGEARFYDLTAAPLPGEDGSIEGIAGTAVDITDWIRAEERYRTLSERTARLHRLTSALAAVATPEQVAEVLATLGPDVMGAQAIFVALPDDERRVLVSAEASGYPADFAARRRELPFSAGTPLATAFRTGEPVFLGSRAERDSRFPDSPGPDGLEALMAAPLVAGERRLGAWVVHFRQPRTFAPEERAFFQTVTDQSTQALDRARLYQEEHHAREEAERANRSKLEFLRAMSHDLRTPLTAIVGYTELLATGVQGPLTEEQERSIDRIGAASRHQLALINDLLQFARLEAGQLELDVTDLSVVSVFDAVEPLVVPQLAAKSIAFARACPSADELSIHADGQRVRQILSNLLTNALKFTEPGGQVTLECEGDDGVVHLRVRDTGLGIPGDQQAGIFAPFSQLTWPRTEQEREAGVGLGLAISRDLARAMGGDVDVESEVGVGSVFTLTLPRAGDWHGDERRAGEDRRSGLDRRGDED